MARNGLTGRRTPLLGKGWVAAPIKKKPRSLLRTPHTQKITSESSSGTRAYWRPWAGGSSGSGIDYRNGMSDSNRITANQDLLHNQTKNSLPLHYVQSLGPCTESAAKLS